MGTGHGGEWAVSSGDGGNSGDVSASAGFDSSQHSSAPPVSQSSDVSAGSPGRSGAASGGLLARESLNPAAERAVDSDSVLRSAGEQALAAAGSGFFVDARPGSGSHASLGAYQIGTFIPYAAQPPKTGYLSFSTWGPASSCVP